MKDCNSQKNRTVKTASELAGLGRKGRKIPREAVKQDLQACNTISNTEETNKKIDGEVLLQILQLSIEARFNNERGHPAFDCLDNKQLTLMRDVVSIHLNHASWIDD